MRHDTRARATSRAGGGLRDARVEHLEPRRLLSAAMQDAIDNALVAGIDETDLYDVTSFDGRLAFATSRGGASGDVSSVAVWDPVIDGPGGGPRVQSVPAGLVSQAVIAAGGKVFFAGGFVGVGYPSNLGSDRVDIYDTATGQWSTAQLSVARGMISAVAVGDEVMFVGGAAAAGSAA